MELEKYGLTPHEMVAVSLYLKTTPLNKSQAARDAGLSPSIFNKPSVKRAVDDQLRTRAERLRLGGDWVLMELRRVYDFCLGAADATNALKALNLIGKHVDVKAFDPKQENGVADRALLARLHEGRQRAHAASARTARLPRLPANEAEHDLRQDAPPVLSFLHPPEPEAALDDDNAPEQHLDGSSDPEQHLDDDNAPEQHLDGSSEAERRFALLSEKEKLEIMMERWRTGKPPE